MILIKKYKDNPGETKEKEFETTLEKELIFLAKTFIDPESMVDLLKEGKTVTTPWATYRAKEISNKQKIENEVKKGMYDSRMLTTSNFESYCYHRGFIKGCKFFGLINVNESVELNAYLVGLFTGYRNEIEERSKK